MWILAVSALLFGCSGARSKAETPANYDTSVFRSLKAFHAEGKGDWNG